MQDESPLPCCLIICQHRQRLSSKDWARMGERGVPKVLGKQACVLYCGARTWRFALDGRQDSDARGRAGEVSLATGMSLTLSHIRSTPKVLQ